METMKFLMISTHFPPFSLGGDAMFVKQLSTELIRRGHEVHVMCNPSVFKVLREGSQNKAQADELTPKIHVHSSRFPRLDLLRGLMLGGSHNTDNEIRTLCSTVKPDVVHWNNTKGFIGKPFSLPGSISFYTAHDYYLVCPRSNLLRPNLKVCERAKLCELCTMRWKKPPQVWRQRGRRVLHLPNETITTSPSEFANARLRREGIRMDHVVRTFTPDPKKTGAVMATEGNNLIYLGQLELHKGPLTALEAFRISMNQQGFHLSIIGEGSLRAEIQRRVGGLGLGHRVSVPGFVPKNELDALMAEAQAVVIPSEWYENAPLVALEAFARGIPVISSDMGGLPEMVGPESGSVAYRAGDASALAQAFVAAWSRRDQIRSYRSKARQAYESRFTPEAHLSRYFELLRRATPA